MPKSGMGDADKPEKTPFEKMEELTKRLLTVSKEEIDRREDARRKQLAAEAKAKSN